MLFSLFPNERHALTFHLLYAVVAAVGLLLAIEYQILPASDIGHLIFGLVAVYNIALPITGKLLGHDDWIQIWLFLVPLSALLVVPDHVLASRLGTLVFPDLGSPQIGGVSLFMAGMWTIPLFPITFLGLRLFDRFSRRAALLGVATSSLVILVGAEAVLPGVPVWYAQGVAKIGHVALYVVLPEMLLGIATFYAVERSPERRAFENLIAAARVTLFYLLCLFFSYLLFDWIPAQS